MNHMLFFGLGYVARTLAARLRSQDWQITATSRYQAGLHDIEKQGYRAVRFDEANGLGPDIFGAVTHALSSIPPGQEGDPVLATHRHNLMEAPSLIWVGYLSTTGVYGDHGGGWVDERTPPTPVTDRSKRRLAAENQWLALQEKRGVPVHIFRLAGIYGPGRNPLASVAKGTARRIVKQGQIFSRIHVADIATVLEASIARPNPGAIYNVCDDFPAPPQDAVAYAAELMGVDPPPDIPFEKAELSEMASSFYSESKRVSNRRIKDELGVELAYPTYRDGLISLARQFTP
jgi:nucleoside-diphosphate-sugar epimerase